MKIYKKYILITFIILLILTLLLWETDFQMPVIDAKKSSYNQLSYWYYPWGKSGTHKGVDIFAKEGTIILPSSSGIVIRTGVNELGGNFVLILSNKLRLHYYAHLREIKTGSFRYVSLNDTIGSVGTTGNAKGKKPHLHYSIVTLVPYFWQVDNDKQGWKKMFYINPINNLNKYFKDIKISK